MGKQVLQIVHIMDIITTYVGKFACLLLLPMIALVVTEVTRRYVFHSPTNWGMDASTFLYAASWALAGGFTLYQKKMVNMDVLYTRFSARGRALNSAPVLPGHSGIYVRACREGGFWPPRGTRG